MLTVSALITGHTETVLQLVVDNDKSTVFNLCSILEHSEKVKSFKINEADGTPITSLYNRFGYGFFAKFKAS
jgi:hypothetical protein